MNRKAKYKDIEKYKETKRRQQQRHRKKYGAGKPPRIWTDEEIYLLMNFNGLDRDLAKKLNRSLNSIYTKRVRVRSQIIEKNTPSLNFSEGLYFKERNKS